jgi:hypothetical protein
MSSVPSIRTEHDGHHFRSRLEARWSIVLTSLGFPWEFEPQMFDLPSGMYLPDFRVFGEYTIAFWIEVKGPVPDAREFTVATEVNLYVQPLIILSGDIPRRSGGGTAWYFDPAERQWFMLSPEEALLRVIFRDDAAHRPDSLGAAWDQALSAARSAKFAQPDRATALNEEKTS